MSQVPDLKEYLRWCVSCCDLHGEWCWPPLEPCCDKCPAETEPADQPGVPGTEGGETDG